MIFLAEKCLAGLSELCLDYRKMPAHIQLLSAPIRTNRLFYNNFAIDSGSGEMGHEGCFTDCSDL